MRWSERAWLVVTTLAVTSGCATRAVDLAPARPESTWVPETETNGEIVAGARATSAAPSPYLLPENRAAAPARPATEQVDPQKAYSLPQLIDLAESTNPSTRIAWNEARHAALAAGIAESTYLPKLTALVLGGFQDSNGQGATQGAAAETRSSAGGVVSAIALEWLLFDFGQRGALVDAARQGSVAANIGFTEAHQQIILQVSLAYYALAAAKARVAAAAQALETAKVVQTAAEERSQRGVGTVLEIAEGRQATALANLAVVTTTGGAEDAYLELVTTLGIAPRTPITVADLAPRELTAIDGATLDDVVTRALARRPDVLKSYAAQKAAVAGEKAASADRLPKLFLAANASFLAGHLDINALPVGGQESPVVNLDGHQVGATVLAGVVFPLYDGGVRAAKLEQARADADSAAARLTLVRDQAVRQIVLAQNAVRTSVAAHAASRTVEAAAQTTLDAALGSYRHGVGSITDVSVAQAQLLQAKTAAADAYSKALSAAATLAFATGSLGAAPR